MKYWWHSAGRKLVLLILACLFGMPPLYAQTYKFTDEDGIVNYTNIKPAGQNNVKVFFFPCYASDPKCNQLDWESVPLNRQAYDDEIMAAAKVFTVDDSLIRAIIHAESAYQPEALSPRGAQGLMQIMPFWLDEIGRADDNLFDINTNLRFGCTILNIYLKREKGDMRKALARYNGSVGKNWYPQRVYKALQTKWYRQ